jgi:hypothetical protein
VSVELPGTAPATEIAGEAYLPDDGDQFINRKGLDSSALFLKGPDSVEKRRGEGRGHDGRENLVRELKRTVIIP